MNDREEEKRIMNVGGLDLGFLWWRTARAEHLLGQIESNASFTFVLGDGEVVEHIKMTQIRRVSVSVLVGHPLPLGGIGVSRPDVLRLEML